jgi:hypothetical protein
MQSHAGTSRIAPKKQNPVAYICLIVILFLSFCCRKQSILPQIRGIASSNAAAPVILMTFIIFSYSMLLL